MGKVSLTPELAEKKFGTPNKTGKGYLKTIQLPYKMRLSWNLKVQVDEIEVHEDYADNFLGVFNDLLNTYGYDQLVKLGIDIYGGCFNYRLMRGGTRLSIHSWGLAIDLDPDRNLLKETKQTARFARIEYKPMIEIFYKWGFESLGIEEDRDWMHFQIAANPKSIPVFDDPFNDFKTTAGVNLRKGAGVNYPALLVIPKGVKVDEIARCEGWSNIEYQGKTGWVSNQYLSK